MAEPSETSLQLPLLDFSRPLFPDTLSSIANACRDWGFLRITNHGISEDLYESLHALSQQAFSLPLDTKLKLGPASSVGTYTPHFIASPFFESLRISGPDYFASAKASSDVLFDPPAARFWLILDPTKINWKLLLVTDLELPKVIFNQPTYYLVIIERYYDFSGSNQQHLYALNIYSDAFQEYGNVMTNLSKKIVSILLKCLGDEFEKKYYESEFGSCHGYLRINSYSPPVTVGLLDVEGLGMHTDMSCITILYQDRIGGLQVRSKEGEWMDVAPSEGTLVVNVGDLLQAWSNGRLRSSEHRVVLRRPLSRLSLAFFWCFEDEKVISAADDVVGGGNQRLYRPFLCRDYIKFRENNVKGHFEKVGYTVDDFAVTTSTQPREIDSRRTTSL